MVDANRAARDLIDIDAEQLNGSDFRRVAPPEVSRLLDLVEATPDEEVMTEAEITGSDGRPGVWEISARTVLFQGRLYAVLMLHDVTQRHALEQGLRQARSELEERVEERTAELRDAMTELEQANEAKSQFLANMSHELRTPLNSIIGFSSVMMQELAGPLEAEQARQLGMINAAGHHLLVLINDLLDLSRIEAGRLPIEPVPMDVASKVRHATELLRAQAEDKGLALEVCLEDDLPEVITDKDRVLEILINLVSNAIKYTDEGGVVVRAVRDDGVVRIEVRDTGVGIAPDDTDRIWDYFHRLGRPMDANAPQSAGLGLAISKRLAHMLNGELEVESELAVGSTFTLTLPTRGPVAAADTSCER